MTALTAFAADARRLASDPHAIGVCFADERPLSPDDREYLPALGGVSGLALARDPR